jgi:hypothetical protein
MMSFRQFDAGPDPFGRKYKVLLKWLQTAISIRHADTVDVKFILEDDAGVISEKTIALPHAELLAASKSTNRPMDDAWCGRIAAMHLTHLIETGDDMDKDLVTLSRAELLAYAQQVVEAEKQALRVA